MLPVSGAWQFIASGARSLLHPLSSASGAYSSWVSPDSEGRNRFHSPRSRARSFSSSTTGGTRVVVGPGLGAVALVGRLGREDVSCMKTAATACSSSAFCERGRVGGVHLLHGAPQMSVMRRPAWAL